MTVQHRQEHRQALGIKTDRQPPRVAVGGIDQRLNFDQQRTCALLRHHHAGSGDILPVLRQEQRRRVVDPLQTLVGHRENTEFVDCTEAVLDRAHEPETGMGVALEVKHGIDDVFEHPRPGQCAILGHMADENDGDPRLLGQPRQLGGAFAHLCDRPGSARKLVRPQGLNRIDDRNLRLLGLQRGQDTFEVDFRHQRQGAGFEAETAGAQRHLFARLLTTDVQHLVGRRQQRQCLQQQRALADAGVAADQHDTAGHQAAAQRAVELADAGGDAFGLARLDLRKVHRTRTRRQRFETMPTDLFGDALDQRVPFPATGALALPFRTRCAALAATVDRLAFCHDASRIPYKWPAGALLGNGFDRYPGCQRAEQFVGDGAGGTRDLVGRHLPGRPVTP